MSQWQSWVEESRKWKWTTRGRRPAASRCWRRGCCARRARLSRSECFPGVELFPSVVNLKKNFMNRFFTKKLQTQYVSTEKLLVTLLYKKLLVICWWNKRLGSILSTCLHKTFTIANTLALNFYFTNNTNSNLTSIFNKKLSQAFTIYTQWHLPLIISVNLLAQKLLIEHW